MSFRLGDLKKSVRKGKQGYLVAPTRLDSRQHAFRICFVLEEFEKHLGQPRRTLDPEILLDFLGDRRIGRGLLAALAQWYRMRPRRFAEVLGTQDESAWAQCFRDEGIESPPDLRGWIYAAVNRADPGFLTPERDPTFWAAQAGELGLRREQLAELLILDRAEEAILVRSGPAPSVQDVMAAYNARAHTTLLRSAEEVTLRCAAPSRTIERAAAVWAGGQGIEYYTEGAVLTLRGAADAFGSWTRHGRRLERAAMELLALEDLAVREITGRLRVGERDSRFAWKEELLAALGAGTGGSAEVERPAEIELLAAALRKARESCREEEWTIRRGSCVVASARAVRWPHLELRRGDASLYLRCGAGDDAAGLSAFAEATPFAVANREDADRWSLRVSNGVALTGTGLQLLGCFSQVLDTVGRSSNRSLNERQPALARAA